MEIKDIELLSPYKLISNNNRYSQAKMYASYSSYYNEGVEKSIKLPIDKVVEIPSKYMFDFKDNNERMLYLVNKLFPDNDKFLDFILSLGIDEKEIKNAIMSIDIDKYKRSIINYLVTCRKIIGHFENDKRSNDIKIDTFINYLMETLNISKEMSTIIINKLTEIIIYDKVTFDYHCKKSNDKSYVKKRN